MPFVYILHSPEFDRYYIGSCGNMEERLEKHNSGATKSTRPFRPWVMIYQESFDTGTEARKRENQIKSYKGGEAFKQLVSRPR
ncbi:GIY-YIG nuclease family protein [Patescibacteria group bacterium]|nr:GIY-YIG nuclease family protein [Patescibacteria group bacterium]MBU1906993.1 GIY-YIG nuclease family protein [Patescibacteria group bacterium]